jgi:uncharacterized protein YjiS (DUF1127 family)
MRRYRHEIHAVSEATMHVATHDILTGPHRASPRPLTGLARRISRILGLWRERTRERRAFAALDRRDLQDLGLSQWTVELELAKPFWRG